MEQNYRELKADAGSDRGGFSDVDPEVSVFMDAVIQIQMPTWHQGRVALVGCLA